jgi:hypothetical protein
MPNKTLTSTEVAINAIDVLHNNAKLIQVIDKQYNAEFKKEGAKIGSNFNIKRPWRPTVSRQSALVVQSFQEDTVPLTLQYQYQVGLNFTQNELALSVQNFRKQVLDPALPAMATAMDIDALGLGYNGFMQMGTAGTLPGTAGWTPVANILLDYSSPDWPLYAGALLDGMSAPRDKRREIIVNQWAMAATVKGLSGLYESSKQIAEQYMQGVMIHALDFDWAMDQNINTLLTGTRSGTVLVNGASQVGSNLLTNGWTAGSVLNAGEIIMVAGIYHVNPENQKPNTGYNATFVVTSNATADGGGNMTIPIYPAITPAVSGSAYGTVNASPATGGAITLLSGSSATYYPVNLAFHGDAFTMATADLVMPSGVDFAARESYQNISILIVRAYDITNTQFPARADVLAGYACTRPELICRITG